MAPRGRNRSKEETLFPKNFGLKTRVFEPFQAGLHLRFLLRIKRRCFWNQELLGFAPPCAQARPQLLKSHALVGCMLIDENELLAFIEQQIRLKRDADIIFWPDN